MKKYLKATLKWSAIVIGSYLLLTTLIMGYSDKDVKKGIYNFHWSGLSALWKGGYFGFQTDMPVPTHFDGADGPYVFGDTIYYVSKKNEFISKVLDRKEPLEVETGNPDFPYFRVKLEDKYTNEPFLYQKPKKMVAVSDIEGNLTALYSLLVSNKVTDLHGNWVFGSGHLVLNGDFMDRGSEVTPVLWWIYHLENQAEKAGGKVHFIIGNHEVLNLFGYGKYNDPKYLQMAKQISRQQDWNKALAYRFSPEAELGKWLRTKNVVEKIGDIAFVHAGLNSFHRKGKYTMQEINDIARKYYGVTPSEGNVENSRDALILSSTHSPYWDRGLGLDFKHQLAMLFSGNPVSKTAPAEVDSILAFYDVSRIVIGHSVVDDICTDYEGKVIKIDVYHGDTMNSEETRGILIEKDKLYKIDAHGTEWPLEK